MKINKTIIEQLRNRDEEAFSKIYYEYKTLVCFIISRYIDYNETQDLVQETFLKLINYLDNNNPEYNDFKLLIEIITKTTCLDYLRKKQRDATIYCNELVETAEDKNFNNKEFNEYLDILDYEEYVLIYYRFVFKFSLKQICITEKYSLDVAKKISSRAMNKIKEMKKGQR